MEQRVEARDTRAGLVGLDVFEKSREATHEFASRKGFRNFEKFLESHA